MRAGGRTANESAVYDRETRQAECCALGELLVAEAARADAGHAAKA
jgi:hypothetical protein